MLTKCYKSTKSIDKSTIMVYNKATKIRKEVIKDKRREPQADLKMNHRRSNTSNLDN